MTNTQRLSETAVGPIMMRSKMGLAETLEWLKAKGYTEDFNLLEKSYEFRKGNVKALVDEFEVDAVYRFDEMSDPADQAVLYAIRSKKTGKKGTLVNAFGIYSDPDTNAILSALQRAEREGARVPAN